MFSLGFCPSWFIPHSIVLELVFAILALFVALYSFRMYKLSKEKNTNLFGVAFLLFSASYFIQSILNIGILFKLSQNVPALEKTSEVINLGVSAVNVHIFFVITSLVILSTIFFKAKNVKLFLLLLAISLIPLFFSSDPVFDFFILSTIYLVFITYHYMKNYSNKGSRRTFIVFFAFLLLLLSNISFILAIGNKLFYVTAHFLILVAYLLILINLAWCQKNEKTR